MNEIVVIRETHCMATTIGGRPLLLGTITGANSLNRISRNQKNEIPQFSLLLNTTKTVLRIKYPSRFAVSLLAGSSNVKAQKTKFLYFLKLVFRILDSEDSLSTNSTPTNSRTETIPYRPASTFRRQSPEKHSIENFSASKSLHNYPQYSLEGIWPFS